MNRNLPCNKASLQIYNNKFNNNQFKSSNNNKFSLQHRKFLQDN